MSHGFKRVPPPLQAMVKHIGPANDTLPGPAPPPTTGDCLQCLLLQPRELRLIRLEMTTTGQIVARSVRLVRSFEPEQLPEASALALEAAKEWRLGVIVDLPAPDRLSGERYERACLVREDWPVPLEVLAGPVMGFMPERMQAAVAMALLEVRRR